MTALTSVMDGVWIVVAARATTTPCQGSSGSPWWVSLVSGLGGALIGGGIAGLAAWFSSEQLRQTAQEELGHERVRLLNERFATAAGLLGHEEPASRLAGVYAMAGLADDWAERRQTCIDVLCAYLRMPYPPAPAAFEERLNWQADREVRRTVIRVIRDHLQEEVSESGTSWERYDFDFTGTVFDGGGFSGARFSGGRVDFTGAAFSGGRVDFTGVAFSGGRVDFTGARFSGGTVDFNRATFSRRAVVFTGAVFSGGTVDFTDAIFPGGVVAFDRAAFSGSAVVFVRAAFSGSAVVFTGAAFSRSLVVFTGAVFSGRGSLDFNRATFSGGAVVFSGARFSGGRVAFHHAEFTGGTVDFRQPTAWTVPPVLDDAVLATPPVGLLLPDLIEPPEPGDPTP